MKYIVIVAMTLCLFACSKQADNQANKIYVYDITDNIISIKLEEYIKENRGEIDLGSMVCLYQRRDKNKIKISIFLVDYASNVLQKPPCMYLSMNADTVLVYKDNCSVDINKRREFFSKIIKNNIRDDTKKPNDLIEYGNFDHSEISFYL